MNSGGLSTGGRDVPPEWIDYNGHMMDAYYFMAFTEATEAFLDHIGLGAAYRARTGSGIYTAESHLCFLSSVTSGATLAYHTQLLGHDAKRLHVFHRMTRAAVASPYSSGPEPVGAENRPPGRMSADPWLLGLRLPGRGMIFGLWA